MGGKRGRHSRLCYAHACVGRLCIPLENVAHRAAQEVLRVRRVSSVLAISLFRVTDFAFDGRKQRNPTVISGG